MVGKMYRIETSSSRTTTVTNGSLIDELLDGEMGFLSLRNCTALPKDLTRLH
jgi:hypothetical protein